MANASTKNDDVRVKHVDYCGRCSTNSITKACKTLDAIRSSELAVPTIALISNWVLVMLKYSFSGLLSGKNPSRHLFRPHRQSRPSSSLGTGHFSGIWPHAPTTFCYSTIHIVIQKKAACSRLAVSTRLVQLFKRQGAVSSIIG